MTLSRLYNRYFKKPLKVYWWRFRPSSQLNFGDEITPHIIKRLTGRECEWAPPDECDLAGTGSIIELLQTRSAGKGIYVWGSGFIKAGVKNTSDNLNFTAVRGKLSLSRIDQKNCALGDPGLLMSLAYPELRNAVKEYKVGIIPHYVDQKNSWIKKNRDKYKIIDVFETPQEVARQINSCELILSSSLHGLIVSDSYNVPNYWLPLSNKLTGGSYKFEDYYSVFNLEGKIPSVSYKSFDDNQVGDLINNFKCTKNIKSIQKNLLKALPI